MQTKHLEAEAWSSLSTVSDFDAGSTAVIGPATNSNLTLRDVPQMSPISLLVESLVEQLCRLLVSSPRQQKKIYNVICSKLHQMNLIDQTYGVEEFEFIRSHYQKALFHFLTVAKSVSVSSTDNAALDLPRYRLGSSELMLSSRYTTEYEELEFIARGGFGHVYKARNKLDGMVYAMKKICVQYHNVSGFLHNLHEVKMLARLNHPNIVSYKAAWLEPLSPAPESLRTDTRSSDEDSGGIVFEKSHRVEINTTSSASTTDKSDVSADRAVCMYRGNASPAVYESAMLYVQMQLCERTLRQWLDERNAASLSAVVDVKQSAAIFMQVVQGICYIHSQRIVHHDIKPSNVFINADLSQVQVGDFGLACCLQHSTEEVTLLSDNARHKGEIGTRLYAAPEQMRGHCRAKSDVYSLGVVLFELLQPFTTEMERCKVITQLRAGEVPPELHVQVPKWAQLISRLMTSSHLLRPSADELCKMLVLLMKDADEGETLESKNETIQQLLTIISQKDQEIRELRRRLQVLEAKE